MPVSAVLADDKVMLTLKPGQHGRYSMVMVILTTAFIPRVEFGDYTAVSYHSALSAVSAFMFICIFVSSYSAVLSAATLWPAEWRRRH